MENFSIFTLQHRGMICTGIRLPEGDLRNELVKNLPHVKWSETNKCWYAPQMESLQQELNKIFFMMPKDGESANGNSVETDIFPNAEEQMFVQRFKQYMEVKNYAKESIKNYIPALIHFLKYFHRQDIRTLTKEAFETYQMKIVIERKLSTSYQNTMISVIKRFYEVVLGIELTSEFISRPFQPKNLPLILSMEEVTQLLLSVKNQKHRMMLSLIYACGLRAGDLIKLKFNNIQSSRLMIHIKWGKGNKDRLVPISQKLLDQLRDYYKIYKPKVWLFEGQTPGEQYSRRSLQQVFKNALKAAKLNEDIKLHNLRHSYATHHIEAGTNQAIIQKILGHKDARTTGIYTQVARTTLEKIYNPFDNLNL